MSKIDILEENKDKVLRMLAQGRNPEQVAYKFGVSERTLWYWLKSKGVTVTELREQYRREKEALIRKGIEDMDKIKETPVDYHEFINLPSVRTFLEEMKASNLDERYVSYMMHKLWDCIKTLNIHPELLDKDLANKYLLSIQDKGYKDTTVLVIKNALRQWLKFLGKPIPRSLKSKEYDGKYKTCYLNVKDRLEFLRTAKKLYPNEYQRIRAICEFLFYTGSRSEALLNVKFREEENHVKAITLEKGKGGKIQWEKIISKELYYQVKDLLPLRNGERDKVREIFKNIIKEMNCDSMVKEYGVKHPIHIWRHTACVSCLQAFNWNIYVVGKLLGWKNPKMIISVYGDIPPETLMKLALGEKVETPPFRFLYNSYLETARNEGLI